MCAEGFGVGLTALIQRCAKQKRTDGPEDVRRGRRVLREIVADAKPLDFEVEIDGEALKGNLLGVEILTGPVEPILDVFSSDAFSFVTLTDLINKLPGVPGRLGSLGLFTEAPVPTTSIALEEQAGILTLVNPIPRGGPGEVRPKPLRRARVLKVPHYQLDDNVLAEEVQNVREFGPQMQPRSVETYLSARMEMFTAQLDATTETATATPSHGPADTATSPEISEADNLSTRPPARWMVPPGDYPGAAQSDLQWLLRCDEAEG